MRQTRGPRNIEKRLLVTAVEERKYDKLVNKWKAATETSMTFSHLIRALLRVADFREKEILKALSEYELIRPANGDENAQKEFEEALAEIVIEAIRS